MFARAVYSLMAAVALIAAAGGCAKKAPRVRPVEGADVAQGSGTLSAARKYLEGRWTLESFEVFPPGSAAVALRTQGTLTYDDFGNLHIEIRADEKSADVLRAAGIDIRDNVISTDGRTVIDLQRRTLTYVVDRQGIKVAGTGPLALHRPRYWDVEGDQLTLTTKDDAGKPLSIGRWKRVPPAP